MLMLNRATGGGQEAGLLDCWAVVQFDGGAEISNAKILTLIPTWKRARRNQTHECPDGDAHAPNARLATHDFWIAGYGVEVGGIHALHVAVYTSISASPHILIC